MSTRILSVFNSLKRVGFAVLIFAGHSLAQPPDVIWDRSGDGNHQQFGYRIYALGDQNDDGFADWAIYATGEYDELPENEARFMLFHGGNPPETTPYMSFVRDPEVYLRYGGQALGDINGDGYIDWGIPVTFVTAPDSQFTRIYLGGPDADINYDYVLDTRPLDSWVRPLGDFNGDGYDDIYHYETNPNDILDVYFGSADFDTFPDWIRYNPSNQNIFPTVTGDFNGDGYGDFVAGPLIPERGLYFGSPDPDTLPRQSWNVGSLGGTGGADLNGDGQKDIVTLGTSQCHVFFGGDFIPEEGDATLNFICAGGGTSEAESAGDFNHDGYDDLVVLSTACNMGWGHLALYLGSPWVNPNPVFQIEGRNPPLNLVGIFSAEALGDVNGDGLDDFAVGAVNEDNDGRRGRVIIFSGDTTYIVPVGNVGPAIPNELSLSMYPNPVNGVATLEISSEHVSGPLGVVVYNILGQQVDRFTLNPNLETRYLYNVAPLASGQYVVQVYNNTSSAVQKLIVLK